MADRISPNDNSSAREFVPTQGSSQATVAHSRTPRVAGNPLEHTRTHLDDTVDGEPSSQRLTTFSHVDRSTVIPRSPLPTNVTDSARNVAASVPPDLTAGLTDALHNQIAEVLSAPETWCNLSERLGLGAHVLIFDAPIGSTSELAKVVVGVADTAQGHAISIVRVEDTQGRTTYAPVLPQRLMLAGYQVYVPAHVLDGDRHLRHALLSATRNHLDIASMTPDGRAVMSFTATSRGGIADDLRIELELKPTLDQMKVIEFAKVKRVDDLRLALDPSSRQAVMNHHGLGVTREQLTNFENALNIALLLGSTAERTLSWSNGGTPRFEFKPPNDPVRMAATFVSRTDGTWVIGSFRVDDHSQQPMRSATINLLS